MSKVYLRNWRQLIEKAYYAAMDKINKDEGYSEKLEISADSGFYNADLLLEAKAPENARIYYTTDGTSPTTEDEAYSGAIELIPKETEKLYNYRFIAFYADGTVSDIESRTYIVGKNVKDRYSTPVLSVYGDPEELFGYEAGIFAYGKAADEFDPDNPVYNSDGKEMNGNFMLKGRENEREVWLDIFSKDGRVLAEQKCGIRIHGKMTRYFEQKSFRLYARREYDDVKNDFKVPVFYLHNFPECIYRMCLWGRRVIQVLPSDFVLSVNVCYLRYFSMYVSQSFFAL